MPLPVVAYSPAVSPSAPAAQEQASVTLREPTLREPILREPSRTIVLWCPDWPVTAALQALGASVDPAAPLALIDKGHVFACSPAARRDGVRRGLKLREAQYRCTNLLVSPYDPVQDARAFEPVIARIEEVTPGVQLIRPGACAIRSRGPTRYYGGEEQAAAALVRCLDEFGVPGARVGIADGPFAAEQAARSTRDGPGAGLRIVPPRSSAQFLAPLPIGILVDERMATLLRRLGVHTLGDFAALPAQDVLRRFGAAGAHAQDKAAGRDARSVVPRVPAKVFDTRLEFEPALDRIDQVTFAIRASAEEFIRTLTQARLVCTAIRVEVRSESGQAAARSWLHPRWFTAADVVDRVRWQLQGGGAIDAPLTSGIASVCIAPERLDSTANHEEGLWGSGPDERIHHGLTRVQSILGHDGVLTAAIGGGRMLADRQILVPWGDQPPGDVGPTARPATQPWPGSLQGLAPATVFRQAHPVALLDAHGNPVDVDDRGLVTGLPVRFSPTARPDDLRPVQGWAGPWPVTERWWDPERSRHLHRFQVVDADGDAWLLGLADHLWSAEARYD